MHSLFEYTDRLNEPYECFIFDTTKNPMPIQPHWHYFMELLYILEGSASIECDHHSLTLQVGDMILFLPHQIHSICRCSKEALKYYVLKFDLKQLSPSASTSANTFSGINLYSIFRMIKKKESISLFFKAEEIKDSSISSIFQLMYQEMQTKDFAHRIIMHSNVCTLLSLMLRKWKLKKIDFNPSPLLVPEEVTIYSITEYIDAHVSQALKVEDIASLCNMSYSHFAKKFKEFYGQSCKQYIEFIRLYQALDLLLFTTWDLTYISQETGFTDCSHFIHSFKNKYGITPKQYRIQKANQII